MFIFKQQLKPKKKFQTENDKQKKREANERKKKNGKRKEITSSVLELLRAVTEMEQNRQMSKQVMEQNSNPNPNRIEFTYMQSRVLI